MPSPQEGDVVTVPLRGADERRLVVGTGPGEDRRPGHEAGQLLLCLAQEVCALCDTLDWQADLGADMRLGAFVVTGEYLELDPETAEAIDRFGRVALGGSAKTRKPSS
jgi:hypothetical protein